MINETTGIDAQFEIAYRLTSACFYQPAAEWEEEKLFQNLAAALQTVAPERAEKAAAMGSTFSAQGLESLTIDYAALFVGPGGLLAPPYGSVYLEQEKRVMGETTMAVHSFYRESGLTLDGDFSELPDHIAVELEFMSYLVQRTIRCRDAGGQERALWLERRRTFLSRFLSPWCKPFCAAIRAGANTPFYLLLADCLEGLISADMAEARPGGEGW